MANEFTGKEIGALNEIINIRLDPVLEEIRLLTERVEGLEEALNALKGTLCL